jgi:hypothetical protein
VRDSGIDHLRVLGRLLMGMPPGPGLDWETLIDLARRHGVAPLLYWKLEKEGRDREKGQVSSRWAPIPAGVREELQKDFYAAAVRGMVAERQLAQVLRALAAGGIPALVVKGAAAARFYPDPALRAYGDLDVLVPQPQVGQVEAVLNELGYAPSRPKAWKLQHGYDLPLFGDGGRLLVEIHWRLDYPKGVGQLPADEIWARAVPWSVEGQSALRLDAWDAALHLCTHAVVKHRSHLGIRPLCDLALIAAGWGPADWEALAQRAVHYGLARPVCLVLALAEQVLGLALPAGVMAALCPVGGEPLPADLVERLLTLDGRQAVQVPLAAVQAAARETLWARARHLLQNLFLPRAGMAHKYNIPADSPRIWLTYLWRPVDLLRRYGNVAWQALRQDPVMHEAWDREAWLERWLQGTEDA